jgi:hypothetical protein
MPAPGLLPVQSTLLQLLQVQVRLFPALVSRFLQDNPEVSTSQVRQGLLSAIQQVRVRTMTPFSESLLHPVPACISVRNYFYLPCIQRLCTLRCQFDAGSRTTQRFAFRSDLSDRYNHQRVPLYGCKWQHIHLLFYSYRSGVSTPTWALNCNDLVSVSIGDDCHLTPHSR